MSQVSGVEQSASSGVLSKRLILASASPRRLELLRESGYTFTVEPAHIDETAYPKGSLPAEIARYLAIEKAKAVAARIPGAVILAADTIVALGDQPLGKPTSADHARQMLKLLEGTTHLVITSVCVIQKSANFQQDKTVMSAVKMRRLSDVDIDRYIVGGLWRGKAGGYGIQDPDPFVIKLSGSRTNIVGLPMDETAQLLASAGILPKPQ